MQEKIPDKSLLEGMQSFEILGDGGWRIERKSLATGGDRTDTLPSIVRKRRLGFPEWLGVGWIWHLYTADMWA